jgi:endonuclease/exonuclease/phosphatase (EEP) superfamily protein YafD
MQDLSLIEMIEYLLPWLFSPLLILLPLALLRRSRLFVGMTTMTSVIFLLLYGRLLVPRLPVQVTGPTFTVMTYNIRFKNPDLDAALAVIKAHNPDVLALHEYTETIAKQFDQDLSERYPFHQVEPGRGLYSRFPIKSYEFTKIGQGEQRVLLDIDGWPVTIYSMHPAPPDTHVVNVPGLAMQFPIGLPDSSEQRRQMETILAQVKQIEGPLMLIGDLNVTDQNPAYAELSSFLQDAHMQRGTGMGFTYSPFSRYPLPFSRIDYVFYSPELTAVDIEVGEFGGSDHKPVMATFMMAETSSPAPVTGE